MRFQVLVAGFLTMTASGVVAAPVLKVGNHDIESRTRSDFLPAWGHPRHG
jgi:hypothetical protein